MMIRTKFSRLLVAASLLLLGGVTQAAEVGRVKTSTGEVQIERAGKRIAAAVGTAVQAEDTLITGAAASVGLSLNDNTLLSLGPNSVVAIDKFLFDGTTNKGAFESTIKQGSLAMVSGKIVKNSPEAVRIKTPSAIMGARGTEFVVRVNEPGN
jgi:hypothetical protein